MEASRAATHLGAFGGFLSPSEVAIWRRLGSFSDYVGVFAVEAGQVLGHAYALRLPYTYPDGRVERVSGVAGVGSRPDHRGRGLARRMLEEIHRRERKEGIDHIALWTNRSWGAHGIYERLGYQDVYGIPLAVRAVPRTMRPASNTVRVRHGRVTDLPRLEEVHVRATRGRIGFTPRLPRSLVAEHKARALDPPKDLLVATDGGRPVGYARVEEDPSRVRCPELLTEGPGAALALIEAMERRGRGRMCTWCLSAVADQGAELRRRGYLFVPTGWYGMMACRLRGEANASQVRAELGVDQPRWVVHRGDQF
ncbi:MAG: GNAT family N-acetyltransferase [Euryarchaeota archaeon]|nr:GNAT family N-acetyltransferase [Euryarchaeota archaeon]MDE1881541.1 GNAT family N-acetyltransferase [Euryarchaeota archaeon]